jgi:hypothetical protein
MSDGILRPAGPEPINLKPLYDEIIDVVGEGHETLANALTGLVVEVIADELKEQPCGNSFARKHRAHVVGCLRRSLKEWGEWRLPQKEV